MSQTLQEIAQGAFALDAADRLNLGAALIQSVEEDPDWAAAWSAELLRRSAEADRREARGESRGQEWSEVKARILGGMARH